MEPERIVSDEVEAGAIALIVVDGINGVFDPRGPSYYAAIEQTVEPIVQLLETAREHRTLIVHTIEQHREGVDDFEWRVLPPHFVQGSFDAQILARFAPAHPLEIVLPKRRFSAFFSTDLALLLREQGIRTVVLAGAKTNVSIRATAQDAFANGFGVNVVREATSSDRPELAEASLDDIAHYMGRVISLAAATALL